MVADQTRLALWLMTLASALFAGTSLIAKTLGLPMMGAEPLPPFMVSAGRFGFALCALLVLLSVRPALRPSFRGARWDLHLARSLCGWSGVTCMFAAVARMPVAEASAISFLNPLVTMALTIVFLGESLTARKLIAAGLAMTGVLLILRPGAEALQPAAFFALGSAALMGCEGIFIKRLTGREPALRILVINNAIGASVAVLVALTVWQAPSLGQWALMGLLGTVMVCGQSLFLQSFKRAEASQVIPAFYAVLVFAALYDLVLFGVVPGALVIAGAGLIVSGAILLGRS